MYLYRNYTSNISEILYYHKCYCREELDREELDPNKFYYCYGEDCQWIISAEWML